MSSIIQRSFRSFSWSAGAQVIVVGIGFARSVLLARLLDVDTFGIYAGATAIVGLLAIPATLGLGGAFLHRAPETEDEDRAAAVFLLMQLIVGVLWLALIVAGALFFASGPTRTAILVIAMTTALGFMILPPVAMMSRRIVLQRVAKIQVVATVVTAVVAVAFAWMGVELWALLSVDILMCLLGIFAYYVWKPIWRPHLLLDRKIVDYYLRFGIPLMISNLAEYGLQKLDDLYVRFFLGVREMGFYSRAYTFANYPRSFLAAPVATVAGSAFAELATNRLQLSKAFFRSTALIIRTSFLFGGLLILVAPELVAALLGEKWLPMIPIFRLFAVFTLLDPLRDVLASIYVALGLPRRLLAYRLIQLTVLVTGLWFLGGRWGAEGVAVAVNLMLVTGIALMMGAVRPYVDFSITRLFGAPFGALVAASAASAALVWLGWEPENVILRGLAKGGVFAVVYLGALAAVEHTEVKELLLFARTQFMRRRVDGSAVLEDIGGSSMALVTESGVPDEQPLAEAVFSDDEDTSRTGKG